MRLRYVACHEFPVLGLGEHLSRSVHKGTMRVVVTLKLKHEPRCRIAEISVTCVPAPNRDRRAVGLALNVVVVGANESSLEFQDVVRRRLVVAINGLLAEDPGRLRCGRDDAIRGSVNEEDGSGGQLARVSAVAAAA